MKNSGSRRTADAVIPAASKYNRLTADTPALMALEPRMVFDAAAAETAAKVASAEPAHDAAPAAQPGLDAATSELIAAFAALTNDSAAGTHAIVFIDGAVNDRDVLAKAAAQNGEIIVLDPNRDGMAQIAAALSGRHDLDAIHIVSHGDAGILQLGSSVLSAASIAGEHADEMAAIRSALGPNGDILVYGCNVAAGSQGAAFVDALAAATGADIAASINNTGSADLGGDWNLEAHTGAIETSTIDGSAWQGSLVERIINPAGGVDPVGVDGLRIYVTDLGQTQVLYQNKSQLYGPGVTDTSTSIYNGIYMAVGTQVIGPDTGAEGLTKVAWSSATPQIMTGTGTTANPYVVTTKLYYDANSNGVYTSTTDVLVEVKTKYIFPNKYFTETVTITPPATNTSLIKYYHAIDTYLDGGDNGPAFSLNPELAINNVTTGNPSFVGVRKAVGTPTESVVGFAEAQGDREFDRYYSAVYNGSNLYALGIANGGDIRNTWDTTYSTDNGIGVQFTLGAIVGPTTFSYHIAFDGDAKLDLDANDSTTGGRNFVNSFQAATGTAIRIVDSDIKITNVVGDIPDVTVTLTNPQAGDILLIDASALPPGITVEGYSPTSITLTGVADEASYETALKQIVFTSTGGSSASRTVTISMHNQLNSEVSVATATLNGDFSPLVDLNSGLAPLTTTNNIVVNSSFSDYADVPYGWTEGGIGAATDGGITGRYGFTTTAADTLTKSGLGGFNLGPSPSGAGRLFVDIGHVNGDTATRTMNISVGGTVYATFTTGGAAGAAGTVDYLAGARNGANTTARTSVPVMTTPTGSATVVQIDLPSSVAASGDIVFSTSSGTDDIYIDNVRMMTSITLLSDGSPGIDFAGAYIENGTPVAIADIDMDIRDGDSANMQSAVVTITNPQPGDRLIVGGSAAGNGVSAGIGWTRTDNVVTLTGSASKASYATLIRSIQFESTSDDPGSSVRDISVVVNDGVLNSGTAHTYVSVTPVNDPPVVDLDGSSPSTAWTTTYKENGAAVSIAAIDAVFIDPDNTTLQSATITLTNPQPGDRMLVNGTTAASGTFASGIGWTVSGSRITLSGNFDKAQYSAAVKAITFETTLDNPSPTPRVIQVTTSDGALVSATSVSTINIDLAPDPVADAASGNEDTAVTGNVLTNDADRGTTPITSVSIVSGPAFGTLISFDPTTGAFVYMPTGDFNGTDSFTYRLTDANGDTNTATVSLTVTPVNDSPDNAVPAGSTVTEDVASAIAGITIGDVDSSALTTTLSVSSGTLTVIAGSGATITGSGGANVSVSGTAVQINAALASLAYTSAPDHAGSATLTVATNDGAATTTDQMAITITPVVDIADDGATTDEDTSVRIDALRNDSFEGIPVITAINGSAIIAGGSVGVVNGSVTLNGDGTLTFAPARDHNGSASFDYTVTSGGATETATVRIAIAPINDSPVNVVPGVQTISEDTRTAIGGISVGDIDGDLLVTTVTASRGVLDVPAGGSATISGNGSGMVTIAGTSAEINAALAGLMYTGARDFAGPASVTVETTDGTLAGVATVSLNITPATDIAGDSAATLEDRAVVIDVLGNDSFGAAALITAINGQTIAAGGFVDVAGGRVTLNADGTLEFAPTVNFNGPAAFDYTVGTGAGRETATAAVRVDPVDDPPTNRVPASFIVQEDTPTAISGVSIIDVDGDRLTTTLSAGNGRLSVFAGGSATVGGNNSGIVTIAGSATEINAALAGLVYRNEPDYAGPATLDVRTSDGTSVASDTIAIDIRSLADIVNDRVITRQNNAITFNALGNDSFEGSPIITHVNGIAVAAGDLTAIANGDVRFNADGTFTFTPAALYIGPASFDYTVTSGGVRETATVSIVVTPPNSPPDAVADTARTGENTRVTGNVLLNDSDLEGDAFAVSAVDGAPGNVGVAVAGAGGGRFTISADGSFAFDPGVDFDRLAAGATATASVSYTIEDRLLGTGTATVTVTVTGANDAPVAAGVLADVPQADGATVSLDVSGAFRDPDSNPLAFSARGLPPGLGIDARTGIITGTIDRSASQTAAYSATITADDGQGGAVSRTFVWTISNPTPVVVDEAAVTTQNATVTGNVLANDRDPDGDPIRVAAVNGASSRVGTILAGSSGGTFIIASSGAYTFEPGTDFVGLQVGQTRTTTIAYTVADSGGGVTTGTLAVTVAGTNDAPVGAPIALAVVDGQNVRFDTRPSFADADGDALTFTASGLPTGLVIDALTGIITGGIPINASHGGPATVTITADDGHGSTATATLQVAISSQPPVLGNDAATFDEDIVIRGSVAGNDSDPTGDPLTFAVVAGPAHGQLTFDPQTGNYSFTPNANYNGTDTFTYRATDGFGGTATASVTFTIDPVNDAPIVVAPISAQGVQDGQLFQLDAGRSFAELDGAEPMTFTATGLPVGLAIDPVTGRIGGTVASDASANGPYAVTVTADDGHGGVTSLTFAIDARPPDRPTSTTGQRYTEPTEPMRAPTVVVPVARQVTSDIVLETPDRVDAIGQRPVAQNDKGIVISTVNRAQALGGHSNISIDKHPTLSQVDAIAQTRPASDIGLSPLGRDFTAWGPEGLTGSSLRIDIDGRDGVGASGRAGQIVIETIVRDRVLYVDLKNTVDPRLHGRLIEYKVLQADGRPLPSWISQANRGLLIADAALGAQELDVKITAVFQDGTTIERRVRIDPATGALKDLQSLFEGQRADAAFEHQIFAAAGNGAGDLDELLQALRAG